MIDASPRRTLAKSITMVESTLPAHRRQAAVLVADALQKLNQNPSGKGWRIGISGAPGVGKSTFIEALGLHLIALGHKVAVLAVDPSSTLSGGSILGDKTRMAHLSVHPDAFVRPSPSGGTLGGVASMTRETMLLCEAAGFDIILVETVGVGQSEVTVKGMVDALVMLHLPQSGDALQAMKKGIMELADWVVVHKADIDATATRHAVMSLSANIHAPVSAVSSLQAASSLDFDGVVPANPIGTGDAIMSVSSKDSINSKDSIISTKSDESGLSTFWQGLSTHLQQQLACGALHSRRQTQQTAWLWDRVQAGLRSAFESHPAVAAQLPTLLAQVQSGQLVASVAAQQLLDAFSGGGDVQ